MCMCKMETNKQIPIYKAFYQFVPKLIRSSNDKVYLPKTLYRLHVLVSNSKAIQRRYIGIL